MCSVTSTIFYINSRAIQLCYTFSVLFQVLFMYHFASSKRVLVVMVLPCKFLGLVVFKIVSCSLFNSSLFVMNSSISQVTGKKILLVLDHVYLLLQLLDHLLRPWSYYNVYVMSYQEKRNFCYGADFDCFIYWTYVVWECTRRGCCKCHGRQRSWRWFPWSWTRNA